MKNDWVPVFSSTSVYELNIVKAVLIEHGIKAVVLDQHDSMIGALNIGHLNNVLVDGDDVVRAKHLIKDIEFE